MRARARNVVSPSRLAATWLAIVALAGQNAWASNKALRRGQLGLAHSLSAATAEAGLVEVPLVRQANARVILAQHDLLGRMGVVSNADGPDDADFEREVLERFAFRAATPEEIADGLATHTGLATRYHARSRGKTRGAVNGDGRAVMLGEVLVRDNASGRVVGMYDLQLKGVPTPLTPTGASEGSAYTAGRANLGESLSHYVIEEYMHANGIPTNRTVAIFDTGEQYTITHKTTGEKLTRRAVGHVRTGSLLRLAHVNYFREDPRAMREIFDYANQRLALETRGGRALGWGALYRALLTRKVDEVADLEWARLVHGSTTYDNVGMLESIDHGTTAAVDRTHQGFTPGPRHVSEGYGREHAFVHDWYVGELHGLMSRAAANDAVRAELPALAEAHALAGKRYRARYATNLLEHIGFDPDDAQRLVRTQGRAVNALVKVFRTLAETSSPEVSYAMPASGGVTVDEPARYDLFRALGTLAALHARAGTAHDKHAALAAALAPLDGDPAAHLAAAEGLLSAAAPLLDDVLTRGTPAARQTALAKMTDQAWRLNAPVDHLTTQSLGALGIWAESQVAAGGDLTAMRAKLRAHTRGIARRGPGSPMGVALALRRGTLASDARGRIELHSSVENGVTITELADGTHATVRVTLAGNPLGLYRANAYRMHFRTDGGASVEVEPVRVEGDRAVFEVPVARGAWQFAASFGRWGHPARYDNGGESFRSELIASAPAVAAELERVARRTPERETQPLRSGRIGRVVRGFRTPRGRYDRRANGSSANLSRTARFRPLR